MNDSISRQAAIDIVEFECGEWTGLAKTIVKEFEQLPPAQPEIILCKDCKHYPVSGDQYEHTLEFPDERCPCYCEDKWYSWRPEDNWFCANGERKEE